MTLQITLNDSELLITKYLSNTDSIIINKNLCCGVKNIINININLIKIF